MEHIEIGDADFVDQVLKSPVPVVVDFWAPWCGPCRMLGPVIEELAEEYRGRVKVVKVNTDENPRVSSALRISSIPTVLFFKDGDLADGVTGVRSKAELSRRIDGLL